MCGLCGVAINPKRDDQRLLAMDLTTELLRSIQKRGTHATGIAIADGAGNASILKRAVKADIFTASDPYNKFLDQSPQDLSVLLGHTRWATHNNAGVDDAAHPFLVGRVVGAHNGMIYNWREVEESIYGKDRPVADRWINDSQAPFGLLSTTKSPVTALSKLDGYWALSWLKGKQLFLCRTDNAPLACAYLPGRQMLLWNSEMNLLKEVLRKADLAGEAEVWETRPNMIYRYDPRAFDTKGTHGEKTVAQFNSRKEAKRWGNVNTARPPMMNTWDNYSTTTKVVPSVRKYLSRDELEDLLMESLAEQEKQRTEIDYLFSVVRDAGLLDTATDPFDVEPEESPEGPYAPELTPGNALVAQRVMKIPFCAKCGGVAFEGEPPLYNTYRDDALVGIYHLDCAEGKGINRYTVIPTK